MYQNIDCECKTKKDLCLQRKNVIRDLENGNLQVFGFVIVKYCFVERLTLEINNDLVLRSTW